MGLGVSLIPLTKEPSAGPVKAAGDKTNLNQERRKVERVYEADQNKCSRNHIGQGIGHPVPRQIPRLEQAEAPDIDHKPDDPDTVRHFRIIL